MAGELIVATVTTVRFMRRSPNTDAIPAVVPGFRLSRAAARQPCSVSTRRYLHAQGHCGRQNSRHVDRNASGSKVAFRHVTEVVQVAERPMRSSDESVRRDRSTQRRRRVTQFGWRIWCIRGATRSRRFGGVVDDRYDSRRQFSMGLHLVVAITLATMISKYAHAIIRSTNLVEVNIDEHDVFRPSEPPVRYGLSARSGAAHIR
jgi:hypothetical protein